MQKDVKAQFRSIRRVYRLSRKVSPLAHENAVCNYMASVSALRTFTGKWDCCEPINLSGTFEQGKKRGKHWYRPLHVALACTHFMKRIQNYANH